MFIKKRACLKIIIKKKMLNNFIRPADRSTRLVFFFFFSFFCSFYPRSSYTRRTITTRFNYSPTIRVYNIRPLPAERGMPVETVLPVLLFSKHFFFFSLLFSNTCAHHVSPERIILSSCIKIKSKKKQTGHARYTTATVVGGMPGESTLGD